MLVMLVLYRLSDETRVWTLSVMGKNCMTSWRWKKGIAAQYDI